jgi:hypothetical protein
MTILGLALTFGGLGFLCWLLFALAIYALPVFVGLTVGAAALKSGAGYGGALILALAAGTLTFALGKFAFATSRAPVFRCLIGCLFALPAAIAGYQASAALARLSLQSGAWGVAFGCTGALAVGVTAWLRLSGGGDTPLHPARSAQSPQPAVAARAA